MARSQKCRATERSPAWLFNCGSSDDSGSAKPMDRSSAIAAAEAPRRAAVRVVRIRRFMFGVLGIGGTSG
jgi:hypothetical protein